MELISILFSFEGRINRRPLWGFGLFVSAINVVAMIIFYRALIGANLPVHTTTDQIEHLLQGFRWFDIVSLVLIWPSLALAVKRAHDRNRSSWFLLLLFVPLVNFWPLIEIFFVAGTPGANSYGPDPLPSAKPGLGWLILLGHLILMAVQANYTMNFSTFFMEHGSLAPRVQKSAPPSDDMPPAAPALRPSAI